MWLWSWINFQIHTGVKYNKHFCKKKTSGEYQNLSLMISQQAITWANGDQCYVATSK